MTAVIRSIEFSQLTRNSQDVMVTEASTLGWQIGFWPSGLELEAENGIFRFNIAEQIVGPLGGFAGFVYRHVTHANKQIHVLND